MQVGGAVAEAGRAAFVDAMSTASIIVALVAAAGAAVAWRYLPSLPRTLDQRADELHRIGAPDAVRGE